MAEIEAALHKAWPDGLPDFSKMPPNGIVDYIDIMSFARSPISDDEFKYFRDLAKRHNVTIV